MNEWTDNSSSNELSVGRDNYGPISQVAQFVSTEADEPPNLGLRIARQVTSPSQRVLAIVGLVASLASIAAFLGWTLPVLAQPPDLFPERPSAPLVRAALSSIFLGPLLLAAGAGLLWQLARERRFSGRKGLVGFRGLDGECRVAWFKAVGHCPVPQCEGELRCYGKVVERRIETDPWSGETSGEPTRWEYTAECKRDEHHTYPVDITAIEPLLAARAA